MSWRVGYSADEAWRTPRTDLYLVIHFSCRTSHSTPRVHQPAGNQERCNSEICCPIPVMVLASEADACPEENRETVADERAK
jgi:hypothetical protein